MLDKKIQHDVTNTLPISTPEVEHETYSVHQWQETVARGGTLSSYSEWVKVMVSLETRIT